MVKIKLDVLVRATDESNFEHIAAELKSRLESLTALQQHNVKAIVVTYAERMPTDTGETR